MAASIALSSLRCSALSTPILTNASSVSAQSVTSMRTQWAPACLRFRQRNTRSTFCRFRLAMRSSSCSFDVASISVTGSHLPHQANHEAQICGRVFLTDLLERLPTMPLPDREQVVDVHLPQ